MSCREGRADPDMCSAKRTALCRALQSWFETFPYNTEINWVSTLSMALNRRFSGLKILPLHFFSLYTNDSTSKVLQIPGHHNFSGPEVVHSHWVHGERGCTSFASWGSSTYHRSCWNSSTPPSFNLSSVWFSSATKSDLRRLRRVVRTAELIIGTTLPTLQELYSSRVSKRAGKITLDPSHLTSSTLSLWTATVWSTLQSSEHQNDQTQEQFISSGNHFMKTWY